MADFLRENCLSQIHMKCPKGILHELNERLLLPKAIYGTNGASMASTIQKADDVFHKSNEIFYISVPVTHVYVKG